METKSHNLLNLGVTINDLNDRMPKGISDCMNVGLMGGCGINCPVFLTGECEEPEEIKPELENMPQSDIIELAKMYDCFKDEIDNISLEELNSETISK